MRLYESLLCRSTAGSYGSDRKPRSTGNPYGPDTLNVSTQSFDVTTCQQAGEAVDAVKNSLEYGRLFSMAFIDVRMPPEPDGIWAAEQIRVLDLQNSLAQLKTVNAKILGAMLNAVGVGRGSYYYYQYSHYYYGEDEERSNKTRHRKHKTRSTSPPSRPAENSQ